MKRIEFADLKEIVIQFQEKGNYRVTQPPRVFARYGKCGDIPVVITYCLDKHGGVEYVWIQWDGRCLGQVTENELRFAEAAEQSLFEVAQ